LSKIGLLFTIAILAVAPVFAQETYQDPAGLFSADIPAGWTDESTDEYGLFTNGGLALYLLTVEADDVQDSISAALDLIAPDFDAEPVQSSEIPIPNGIWTQNVFILEDNALWAVIAQVKDGIAYMMVVQAPDQPTLAALTNDVNSVLLSITIGEGIDLAGVEPAELSEDMLADLEAYIEDLMERFEMPGAAVAVVQNDEVVYANGFGVKDINSGEAVTSDTLFMIGSVTKSMTTMMMASLVDEGILDWDTPVVDILPTFALSNPDVTPDIRVRDLVNMSSGVQRYDVPMFLEALTPVPLIEFLDEIPMNAEPGEQFNYSNQMVTAGGFVAALAAGAEYDDDLLDTYADLLQTRLFDPIGMGSTTLDFDAAIAADNVAAPHSGDLETNEIMTISPDFERFAISVAPAGAVWSTVEDMAQYMRTQLNHGIAPNGARVVSEENLAVTQSPEIVLGGPTSYGMGWLIDDYHGQQLIWHNGGTLGFSADISFMPDADLAVVVLANRAGGDNFNHAVREYIFELAFELEHEADARYTAAMESLIELGTQLISHVRFEAVDADAVADFLGQYEQGVEITMSGDQFTMVTDYGESPLYGTDEPDTFVTGGAVGGFQLVFARDDGDVTLTIGTPLDPSQNVTLAKVD
jgi:CubicO group peptidase (beta-lactamase class C family)